MVRRAVITSDDSFDDYEEDGRPTPGYADSFSNVPSEEDALLRPTRMFDMVGQRAVYERVEIAVQAAQKRGEPLGHILFDGPPGLGKTTFATCIPRELGVDFQIANGATMLDNVTSIQVATGATFVARGVAKTISNLTVDCSGGVGTLSGFDFAANGTVNLINIPEDTTDFTVSADFDGISSENLANLNACSINENGQMREHLDFYSEEELAEIARRNAAKLHMNIDDAAAREIASRSRGTPRLANNRLRWVRDYADARANGVVDCQVAKDALKMQGIDENGLDAQDRRYLETIWRVFQGGPVGVEAVAHTMSVSPDSLEDEVEPFLLRSELLVRTPRGRRLTAKGLQILGIEVDPIEFGTRGIDDKPNLFNL